MYAEHTLHRIDACNDVAASFLSGAGIEDVNGLPANSRNVMLSHHIADQAIVARIATALRGRGYAVSVNNDVACSTVATMRTAVQHAAAALVCVSQSYIESPVCRAEAMHIQQSGVFIVPLLVHQSEHACEYQGEPKYLQPNSVLSGWARNMFAHKIQHYFLDQTVGSSSAFEIRVDELVRALGGLDNMSDSTTAKIDEISVIQQGKDAEEKCSAALTSRLLKDSEQRRLVLAQVLEHVTLLLARSSRDRLPALDRKTMAQLRSRSSALLNDVNGVTNSTTSSSAHALCARRWPQYVGESTGAVLSDVFRMDDLRTEHDVNRVQFLLEFIEKLGTIMQGRVSVLTDHIETGGRNCARVLLAALDHGMQVLDSIGTNQAHDSTHRSALLSLSTEIGFSADVLNKFDAKFCNRLASACRSGRANAASIAQLVLNVEQLTSTGDPLQSHQQVSALLAAIEEPVLTLESEQAEQARVREAAAKEVAKPHQGQLEQGQLEAEITRALSSLSSRALRQRAEAVGIDEAAMSRAYQSKEPKRALIALVLSAAAPSSLLAGETVAKHATSGATQHNTTPAAGYTPSQLNETEAHAPTTIHHHSSEISADDNDPCSQGNATDVLSGQDSTSSATVRVHVDSHDSKLITESATPHKKAAETELTRAAARGPADAEESESATSESSFVQQMEVEVATGLTGDHVVPGGNDAHSGDRAQKGEESAENDEHDSWHICDTRPTSAAVAGTAQDCDGEEGVHGEDNGDFLDDGSSVLPVHPHSSLIVGSETGMFVDSTGRVVELPVVDLELAAQGSRLRKERMRLQARAASPASRGAV
jgi:hypothetical protein